MKPRTAAPRSLALARALSILGHPAVVVPLGVALAARARGAPLPLQQRAVAAAIVLALLVGLYSVWQVRRGRWAHVDASQPRERSQLHAFLLPLLLAAAAAAALAGWPPAVTAGLGACAVIVTGAWLTRRWMKLSLHVAFAALVATWLWPSPGLVLTAAAGVAAIAWSRWRLARHTSREVVAGALLGALVGLLFQYVLVALGSGRSVMP